MTKAKARGIINEFAPEGAGAAGKELMTQERPGGRARGSKKVLDKPKRVWYNKSPVVRT